MAPVVEWYGVFPGVVSTNLSWIIQGKLTVQSLLCQLTTDSSSSSEVSSVTLKDGLFSAFFFFVLLYSPSVCFHQLSCDPFRGVCEVQLKHLSPGRRYSVRVRCSLTGRLWGPWTQAVSFKTCEAPQNMQ